MFRPADALASAGPPIIYESALRASVNAPARPRLVAQCKRNNRIGRQDQAASRFVLPHQRKNLAKSGRFKRSGPPIYMRANYASTLTRDVHSAFAARCAITGARLLRQRQAPITGLRRERPGTAVPTTRGGTLTGGKYSEVL